MRIYCFIQIFLLLFHLVIIYFSLASASTYFHFLLLFFFLYLNFFILFQRSFLLLSRTFSIHGYVDFILIILSWFFPVCIDNLFFSGNLFLIIFDVIIFNFDLITKLSSFTSLLLVRFFSAAGFISLHLWSLSWFTICFLI